MNNNKPQFEPPDDSLIIDPRVLKKAKEGDSFAQLDIGQLYYSATNLADNYEQAFYWLKLAAEQKNMKAEFMIGDLYALGKGVEKHEFIAYEWYIKSAIQGYPKASTRLHNLYHGEKSMSCRGQRDSGEEQWDQAIFKKQNNIRELNEYRLQQLEPKLTEVKKYFEYLFKDLKEKNTKEAYLTLGFLYQNGFGIRKIILRSIKFYTLAAEMGDTNAQYNLASIYHQNHEMKWNYREAFKWYTKAVEGGSICAHNGLAFLYLHGLGVDISHQKAVDLYICAAERRHVEAQVSLGCIFRKGEIAVQDYIEAARWYRKAAMEGSTVAQNCLESLDRIKVFTGAENTEIYKQDECGICPKNGLCLRLWEDIASAEESFNLEELRKLAMRAMRSDGHAMFDIGMKYYRGNQFKQDADVAFRWIRNAAKAELIKAQCKTAEMYKNGDTVEQNYLNASIWYKKAAKKGDANAQYNIGQMYYQGLGVRKDPLEASKWYFFAAEKEKSDAQCQLGILYERGEGLRQDKNKAEEWYFKSARQKNPNAIYRLGMMKENKDTPDSQLAHSLFKKAASLGSLDAQLYLADSYSNEKNPRFNLKESFRYYEMASIQKNPEAKYKLAVLCLHGDDVDQDFYRAYYLFKESSMLGYKNAENIFQVPIDYRKTKDINYKKLELMFKLVCRRGIASLEYNLGFHYEYETRYIYKTSSHKNSVNKPRSKYWYEIAAEKNNSEAQYRLGVMYEQGDDIPKDISKAIEYYQLARGNGNSEAVYRLARMYLDGYGVLQNFDEAFYLFKEASNAGHKDAINILNVNDEFIKIKNHTNIIKMLEVGANSGDVTIQYQLGILNLDNEAPTYNVQEALKWLLIASERGYTEASYSLGLLHEEGTLIDQDFPKAISFYKTATGKGHANSLYQLARLYHCGRGIALDYLKAFELYTSAAEHGNQLGQIAIIIASKSIWEDRINQLINIQTGVMLNYDIYLQMWECVAQQDANLQYNLGRVYEEERLDSDMTQALEWYSKAADHSHTLALLRLGSLYELGIGVEQDFLKAFEFYERAAKAHNIDALCRLGILYQNGSGVKADFLKALGFFKNAAKQGNSRAQFILGNIYEKGEGAEKNFLEAFKWYTIAAAQGNKDAEFHVDVLCNPIFSNDLFYRKWFRLLSNSIDLDRYTYHPKRSFMGEVNYKLGIMYYYGFGTSINYEKAWNCFRTSAIVYDESRAMAFQSVRFEYIDLSAKTSYLKKLEMLETVAKQLPRREKYELGFLYYHGFYVNSNDLESDLEYEIIKPDPHKASLYFKMIIGQRSSDVEEVYANSSYYMGMISHINATSREDNSRVIYYLQNASNGGHKDACNLLQYIENNEGEKVNKLVMEWHQENIYLTDIEITYNLGWLHSKGVGTDQDYEKAFQYYKKAAEKGHSKAQYKLANLYYSGFGVDQDYLAATEWYKKAAEGNISGVNCNLGFIYLQGLGGDKNYAEALKYFGIAAEKGVSIAQCQLAYMYLAGYGVEKNMTTAIQWLEKAADQNHINANHSLGEIYFEGRGVEKDYVKALEYYKIAGELGFSSSQFEIGYIYDQGYGVERNTNESFYWFKKAAEQGHVEANYNMGTYYESQGTDQDYKKALEYYKVAANKDYIISQLKVGLLYRDGYGVKRDYIEAIKWFEKAGKNNNAEANYNLGNMYFYGRGVDIDYETAFKYYTIAAKKGDSVYQYKMGRLYLKGYGVDIDYNLAYEWFRKSGDQDNASANYSLGELYLYGQGVDTDYEVAFKYFYSAAEKGYDEAQFKLGWMYAYGCGVELDYKKGMMWYKRAAEKNIIVNYYLGNICALGLCGNKDYKEALKHYKIAAKNGHVEAQIRLGYCYFWGQGTDKNEEKGIQFLADSSNANDLVQSALGGLYHSASIANQDFSKALKCYQESSQTAEDGDALRGIGLLYEYGDGVKQSYHEALTYYKLAAETNNIGAYYNLGLLYYNGNGVVKNYDKSFEYFSRALEEEIQEERVHLYIDTRTKYVFRKQKVYALVPESYLHGEIHYYLGKMYENGQGVCVNHTRASEHLKIAIAYGNEKYTKTFKISFFKISVKRKFVFILSLFLYCYYRYR